MGVITLINEGLKKLKDFSEKNVIVILGGTGTGKSTLINSLLGKKLMVKEIDFS